MKSPCDYFIDIVLLQCYAMSVPCYEDAQVPPGRVLQAHQAELLHHLLLLGGRLLLGAGRLLQLGVLRGGEENFSSWEFTMKEKKMSSRVYKI